jgi:hypothetical protein
MNALYARAQAKTNLQTIIEMQKTALACGGCAIGIGGPNQFIHLIKLIDYLEKQETVDEHEF